MKRKPCPYCDELMSLSFEISGGWCCTSCGVFVKDGKIAWVRGKLNVPWSEPPDGILVLPDRKEV